MLHQQYVIMHGFAFRGPKASNAEFRKLKPDITFRLRKRKG
jgi:hypothetical protein